MTKRTSLKRSFVLSLTSLILCVAMLLGTTFAWFSETITSGKNVIKSGNLDVELEYYSFDEKNYSGKWQSVHGSSEIFDPDALWEPGYTQVVYLKLSNVGSLEIRYNFAISVIEETLGLTADGKNIKLSDHINFSVIELADDAIDESVTNKAELVYKNRSEALEAAGAGAPIASGYEAMGEMKSNDVTYLALVVFMPTTVGNEANHDGKHIPKIDLGLNLVATQRDAEEDSFGSDYDKLYNVTNADELAEAVKNNGMITIMNDFALPASFETMMAGSRSGNSYTGDAFKGTINGNGHTISGVNKTLIGVLDGGTVKNLKVEANINTTGDSVAALVGVMVGGTIENVTVNGSVTGDEAAGGVVGRILGDGTVKNCTNNAAVTSTGASDAAGGIVGKAYYTKENAEMNIIDCENNGAISSGYAAGGIAGFSAANIMNCSNSATVTSTGKTAGGIVGEQTNYGQISGNTNSANITANVGGGNAGGIIGWIRYQNSTSYPLNEIIEVSNNTNYGSLITSNYSAGGIVGLVYNQAIITGNTSYAESITGSVFASGIAGGLQLDNYNLTIPADVRFTVTGNTTDAGTISANCINDVAYNNDPANPAFAKIENNTVLGGASTSGDLASAIQNANPGDTLYVSAGKYDLRFTNDTSFNTDGLTIIGLGNVQIAITSSEVWYGRIQGDGVTFENIHFTSAVGATGKATYNNCRFDSWTIAASSGAKETFINNCVINGCLNTSTDFNSGNTYVKDSTVAKAEYSIRNSAYSMNFKNCNIGELITWGANTVLEDCTIAVENITCDDGSYIFIIDGEYYAGNPKMITASVAAGATKVTLLDGDYVMPEPDLRGKTLTLVGGEKAVINASAVDGNDQFVTGATIAFEGVTLNFGKNNYMGFANPASLTYTDCTINGLQFLYGDVVSFVGCTLNSGAAEHSAWTYGADKVSFTDCDFTYGDRAVNCYSEAGAAHVANVTFNNCKFTKVDGVATTGAIETNSSNITALNLTINNCSVNEGKLWFVAGWDSLSGANTTVTVNGSTDKGVVLVQSGVLPYLTLNSNSTYMLTGDFGGNNVALTMPVGVENVIFDGSKATNINELIIVQNGKIIDNANDPIGERSGNVTVQNFNVLSQINVFACKTEVVVQKNTAEALMIHAGNCDVKVLNNTIDANFESHPTYRDANNTWNTNNYGIALNIFDYNLWLDGNTVTDTIGHAIGINGWETTIDNGDENVIESFKGNTITVNSTSNTKRAAFKVWDDETYASNDDDTNVINATAQAFIDAVLADGSNTFNIKEGYDHTIFSFYNVNRNN